MLSCVSRTQNKNLKIELKNKNCIENINFKNFKIVNAQFSI